MTTQSNNINQELSQGLLDKGRYRPLNFFKSPFSLSSPICIGKDTNEKNMFIVLYDLQSIKEFKNYGLVLAQFNIYPYFFFREFYIGNILVILAINSRMNLSPFR